jgi:carbon storage regulator
MLVLSRKINETIVIGGNIRVTMTAIRSRQVRLAIEAPPEIPIVREELLPIPPSDQRDRERTAGPVCRINRDRARRSGGARSFR